MKKTNEEEKITMSEEMKKNCKKAIAEFGFDGKNYDKFLNSVAAMKGTIVLKYPNEEINEYREKFIKGRENSFSDALIFDKMVKIRSTNENGYSHDTGYFCPRNFWDAVVRMK